MKLSLQVDAVCANGSIAVTHYSDMSSLIQQEYDTERSFDDDETLVDGLRHIMEYFSDNGYRSIDDHIKLHRLIMIFLQCIKNKDGKFYLWSVDENNLSLMFDDN